MGDSLKTYTRGGRIIIHPEYKKTITILVYDSVSFRAIGRTDTYQLGITIKINSDSVLHDIDVNKGRDTKLFRL